MNVIDLQGSWFDTYHTDCYHRMDISYYKLQQTREYGHHSTVCGLFSLRWILHLTIWLTAHWGYAQTSQRLIKLTDPWCNFSFLWPSQRPSRSLSIGSCIMQTLLSIITYLFFSVSLPTEFGDVRLMCSFILSVFAEWSFSNEDMVHCCPRRKSHFYLLHVLLIHDLGNPCILPSP